MSVLIARYRKAIVTNNRKEIEKWGEKIENELSTIENFSLKDKWEELYTLASF